MSSLPSENALLALTAVSDTRTVGLPAVSGGDGVGGDLSHLPLVLVMAFQVASKESVSSRSSTAVHIAVNADFGTRRPLEDEEAVDFSSDTVVIQEDSDAGAGDGSSTAESGNTTFPAEIEGVLLKSSGEVFGKRCGL